MRINDSWERVIGKLWTFMICYKRFVSVEHGRNAILVVIHRNYLASALYKPLKNDDVVRVQKYLTDE